MGKILIIAEKPSVGQDMARILGCKTKKAGYFVGDDYMITWAIGHLVTQAEPEDYDARLKRWSLNSLPIVPEKIKLKLIPGTKKQFDVVQSLMNSKEVDSLICATDAGREGELIFRYIYQLTGCNKPFQRLWISSMTDEAVKKGFANLKPGSDYDNLFFSARCRAEADWMVGINATRAFTVRQGTLLSIGRVQTPTLALLVQRHHEIDSFVPQEYWELKAHYQQGFTGLWFNNSESDGSNKISSKEEAQALAIKVEDKTGIVSQMTTKDKRELPPQLYDLTSLQRDANKLLGFSAKKTLEVCQKLYERHKVLTYPRTDSKHLSQDMVPQLKPLLLKLHQPPYVQWIAPLLQMDKLPISGRMVDDSKVSDHHAIIPTGKLSSQLSMDEKRVFDMVVIRFLAGFYPIHEYQVTTVEVTIEEETFISKGKIILKEGWKAISLTTKEQERGNTQKKDQEQGSEQEQALPLVKKGDNITVVSTQVTGKKTQPPKPYTDASLLAAMEHAGKLVEDEDLREALKDGGLGTPATRAGIFERLLQVGYVQRKGKALQPTNKGIQLIGILPEQLKSAETTGRWEKGLNVMAKGKLDPNRFMESIIRYVNFLVTEGAKTPINPEFSKMNQGNNKS